jgi:tetratricopeptide (TPR) repeat protein
MQNEKRRVFAFGICSLLPAVLLSGCIAFKVGGEIQAGRSALRNGDPDVALPHFQRAAELDDNYLLNLSVFDQGVWTYVGRSYYALGKLAEARQALERARSRYERDQLARLYLGLVLARNGNRQSALGDIEAGLRGLEDWFEDLSRSNPQESSYWDPGQKLDREIKGMLAMIGRREIDWSELIARAEELGEELEEEIELVRQEQYDDTMRDGDDHPDPD